MLALSEKRESVDYKEYNGATPLFMQRGEVESY